MTLKTYITCIILAIICEVIGFVCIRLEKNSVGILMTMIGLATFISLKCYENGFNKGCNIRVRMEQEVKEIMEKQNDGKSN